MTLRYVLPFAALGLSSVAWANNCATYEQAAKTAEGESLVEAYVGLTTCNPARAKEAFPAFMRAAGNLETLTPLAIAAIDADAWTAVWDMMKKVPYEHRKALANGIGASCGDHAKVVPFLQGAHSGLKGTEFAAWAPAIESCPAEPLTAWLEKVVVEPPRSPYNEKYNAVLTSYAKIKKADALPVLEKAAIAAGNNDGPFNNVIDTMQRAITPESVADRVTDEVKASLEQSLVRVASGVTPENARMVADRLYTAGSEELAASLLPAVYPKRVQPDGGLMWGVASVESCDGQAIIHWRTFVEQPKRLAIVDAASGPMRSVKSKLKCTPEGEWPVFATTEPLGSRDDATGWLAEMIGEWEGKGLKVKAVEEKKTAIN